MGIIFPMLFLNLSGMVVVFREMQNRFTIRALFDILFGSLTCGQWFWCCSGSCFGPALPLWLMIIMRQFVKIKTIIHLLYVVGHRVCYNY